ncbi:MAG: hypothetical protein AB1896_23925, partial [Thermodesulfobacteriota bacterium]
MTIIEFQPWHLEGLEPREEGLLGDWAERDRLYKAHGPAFSLEHGGRVLACGGVVLTGPDEGWGWAVVGRETAPVPLGLARTFISGLDTLEKAGLRRVWTLVRTGFRPGARWARFLGFRPRFQSVVFPADEA